MSDMIPGPPKTVQQSHNLRTVRQVNLNEQRSDEKRHLAELEERMRRDKRRKLRDRQSEDQDRFEETASGDDVSEELPAEEPSAGEPTEQTEDGHIDFTA